jgi:UDP-N-acetylglucosamine acyltransferase
MKYIQTKNNNVIHETTIIYKSVELGSNNIIGPYCIIYDNVKLGSNNVILSHTTIGSPPEHKQAIIDNKFFPVIIGDNNRFNEFVTVNSGAFQNTVIGNDCFFLRGAHVGHDSVLGNGITVSCNSLIGGHSIIDDHANLGLGSICHQFTYIGKGSMIGMGGVVTKNKEILPFAIYVGNPAKYLKRNDYLIKKHDITSEQLLMETSIYLGNLYQLQNKL